MLTKSGLYGLLEQNQIPYEAVEHPAVYTMAELETLHLPGQSRILKNLFLRDDKKKSYYLVSVRGDRALNLKELRQSLKSRPLSFASSSDLASRLHLEPGHVTPLAALNDETKTVIVVMDAALRGTTVGVHPMENTATVFLSAEDLVRILQDHGITVIFCDLP